MAALGVRTQLALWHGLLMAVTLSVLAGLSYWILLQVLYSRADEALLTYADSAARQAAMRLYRRNAVPGVDHPDSLLATEGRAWGRHLQLVDPVGKPVEMSDGLKSQPLPVTAAALAAKSGNPVFETLHGLADYPVRLVTVPVLLGEQTPYLVQAAGSLEGVEAALGRAAVLLSFITPLVFLVSLLGNWFVVQRALKRVDVITRQAVSIEGRDLRRRLDHHGPNDEIGRLASAFDQMIARLDESFQQVARFSADASHELRTPLAALRGQAEVALMTDQSPDEYRECLRRVLESSQRMSQIVDSLLTLSQADAGVVALDFRELDLSHLVVEVIEAVEPLAFERGVRLEIGDLDEVNARGDSLWIRQALLNVVQNALQHTPPGGTVSVTLGCEDATAVLTVRDTGPGVPAEALPRIFARFYRADRGRTRGAGGAGLGLSIVRWVMEAHAGSAEAENHPEGGLVVRLRLPTSEGSSMAASPPPEPVPSSV